MRFLLFPSTNSKFLSTIGLIFVIVGQLSRSLGMVTCGESFNHMIQKSKKNNHVLGGEHYWFPCLQRVQQIVILWRVWFTPIPFDLQFCHLVRDNPSSYVETKCLPLEFPFEGSVSAGWPCCLRNSFMAGNLPTKKPALAGSIKNSKYKTYRQYMNLRWTILEEVLDAIAVLLVGASAVLCWAYHKVGEI